MKTLFVSYKQYGRNSIFGLPCYTATANHETIAQYKYVMKLKNIQLNMIETQLYFDEETDKNIKE